jgi:hypothetical protein
MHRRLFLQRLGGAGAVMAGVVAELFADSRMLAQSATEVRSGMVA